MKKKIITMSNFSGKNSNRKFSSIFLKNLFLLSLVILLPMIIVIWIATFSFNAFTEKEIDVYSSKSLAMITSWTSNMIYDCMQQMNYLAADTDATTFLISEKGQMVSFYNDKTLNKMISVQMRTKDYLSSIYLYSDKNNLIFSNYGLSEIGSFFDTGWYGEYKAKKGPSRFWVAFRNTKNAFQKPVRMLSLYRTYGFPDEQSGVLVFNIDFDKFIKELSTMRSYKDTGLFISSDNRNMLIDVWGDHRNFPLDDDNLARLMQSEKSYEQLDDYVLYKAPVRYTDWYYIYMVPNEMYQLKIRSLIKDMMLVIYFGFAITIAMTIFISIRIYQPYKRILHTLQEPASLVHMEQKISNREESYILNTIRNTINENATITQELNERVTLLKKAQTVALQSQINPHFLYNTLDTISWSAMRLTGGKNETSVMITHLANMIRYSLDSIDNLVPLESEVENIRIYLELQELRYKNKFSVVWEIDDNVSKCKVPKIMLQPLVENAIYHGIKPMPVEGIIWIIAKKLSDILTIVIKDNGVGMNQHLVKQINDMMQKDKIQEKEYIGIRNVNQRIQLFFGDQYGITLESEEGMGTAVVITMPYEI